MSRFLYTKIYENIYGITTVVDDTIRNEDARGPRGLSRVDGGFELDRVIIPADHLHVPQDAPVGIHVEADGQGDREYW